MNSKPRSALPLQALKTMPPARRVAYLTLEHSRSKAGTSSPSLQSALDQTLRTARLKPLDAALATNLAYETCRYKERLEWLLHKFLSRPERLVPAHKDILLLAACELVFMDAVPPYASINWAVNASKAAFGQTLGGLTNAVLRKVADLGPKTRDHAFFAAEIKDPSLLSAVWHAQPNWITTHFTDNYPAPQARAYLEAFIAEPAVGVRINRLKPDWEPLTVELAAEEGCLVAQGSSLAFSAAHKPASLEQLIRDGRASRQSYAAQEALAELLNLGASADANFSDALRHGLWDACAGHGGKTCALLEAGIPVCLASDVHTGRLMGLRNELDRLGLSAVAPILALTDAATSCPLRQCPPIILADVPCSGLGTLNHRPDIKYKRAPGDLPALANLQRRILDNLYACLPSGGWLLYLTCTLNPTENQGQMDALLKHHPSAAQLGTWQTPPDSPAREFFYGAVVRKDG